MFAAASHGQNAERSLAKANDLKEQGKPAESIELINSTLKAGNVPSQLAARAMLMRAEAQEKLGKHAYALADYNSALWMQELSDRDRSVAETGRQRIMAKLGVGQSPSGSSPQVSASASTEIRTTASENRTGGVGTVFSSAFESIGGSERQQPVSSQANVQPPVIPAQSNSQIAPVRVSNVVPVRETAPAQEASVAQRQLSGDFAIQFSSVRSEDNALYEADRIDKRYGEWLGGRTPSITIRGMKDGGTLYKIIAQPYEHGEGIATCELLKTKGVDCMLISR